LDKLLELLFTPTINDGAAWLGRMFKDLALLSLYIENSISVLFESDTVSALSANTDLANKAVNIMSTAMSALQKVCLGIAVSMIILKFFKKGFETYVLWTDGDPDADPLLLTTNFFKALAVAMSFPVLYGYLADITQAFSDSVKNACTVDSAFDVVTVSGAGLFYIIGLLVAVIMLLVLYLQFIKRGVEMFVLRLAIPIGCVGLLDSDHAMYKAMMQKLYQCAATIVVQVGLAQLALSVILAGHAIIGIAVVTAALSTPKFLQEFMVPGSSGINSATIYQVSRMFQMAKGVLTK
jgi:hypothetical protein